MIPDWDRCKTYIEDALKYAEGTHDIADIERGIESGQFQFWAGKNAAIVSEFVFYPKMTALNFFLIGGDLEELKDMEQSVTAFAKATGCTRVMGIGRKGFERVLKSKGYTPRWFCFAKEL